MDVTYLDMAADKAIEGMRSGPGGPFGAALVRDGKPVVVVGNTVGRDHDWTGHAESLAVREAGRLLGTLDLSDCVMYATCQPCPMCVAAMMWAGITTCYYGSTKEVAAANGFSDQHIRDYLDGSDPAAFELVQVPDRASCDAVWEELHSGGRPSQPR